MCRDRIVKLTGQPRQLATTQRWLFEYYLVLVVVETPRIKIPQVFSGVYGEAHRALINIDDSVILIFWSFGAVLG